VPGRNIFTLTGCQDNAIGYLRSARLSLHIKIDFIRVDSMGAGKENHALKKRSKII
jgi:hypothetical protein